MGTLSAFPKIWRASGDTGLYNLLPPSRRTYWIVDVLAARVAGLSGLGAGSRPHVLIAQPCIVLAEVSTIKEVLTFRPLPQCPILRTWRAL